MTRDDSPADDRPGIPDGDPLTALHAAWQRQSVPEATPDLDDCDDETQAVVAWMAAAWAAQPLPSAVPPSAAPRSLRPVRRPRSWFRARSWPQLTRHAAAALLLVGLTLTLLSGPRRSTGSAELGDTAGTVTTSTAAAAETDNAATTASGSPRLVAVADDHIVFRSGPVRLVLITDHLAGE